MSDSRIRLFLAFAVVYLVWGSTYLGLRIGVRDIPPGLLAGVRFVCAGLILYAAARVTGLTLPRDRVAWRHALVMALLLIVLGNGLVTWAEQWVESNLAALLISTGGFWLAILGTFGPKGQPLTAKTVAGLIVGFVGAILILWPDEGIAVEYLGAQIAILVSPLAWSLGTVYGRNASIATPPLMFAAMQMFIGGLILTAIGLAAGELPHWSWTVPGTAALVYLTLFGSCLAYGVYVWLINHTTPSRLSTISYGNLAVATLLGWWLLDETLSHVEIVGMAIIVAGMLLVNAPVGRLIRGSRIVRRRP